MYKRWQTVWSRLVKDERHFQSNYISYALWQRQADLIRQYGIGIGLDLGAGQLSLKPLLNPVLSRYIGLDIAREHPDLDVIADGQHLPLASQYVETIISSQVLEHIPHPWIAMDEIARVLKADGILILSVPFLFHIHGEPHDYYRFTPYALKNLLEDRSFEIINLEVIGGLLAFVIYFVQTLLIFLTYGIPVISLLGWQIVLLLNVVTKWLDPIIGFPRKFPVTVIAVARKKHAGNTSN